MGLNDLITDRFEITIKKSKQEILNFINEGNKKQTPIDIFVPTRINYKAFNTINNTLEIIRMPTMINPFRPHGKITIQIEEVEPEKTTLNFEILPYDGTFPIVIGLFLGFLTLWSLCILIFAKGFIPMILVIPIWITFGLIFYLSYLYTKRGLKAYSRIILDEINKI